MAGPAPPAGLGSGSGLAELAGSGRHADFLVALGMELSTGSNYNTCRLSLGSVLFTDAVSASRPASGRLLRLGALVEHWLYRAELKRGAERRPSIACPPPPVISPSDAAGGCACSDTCRPPPPGPAPLTTLPFPLPLAAPGLPPTKMGERESLGFVLRCLQLLLSVGSPPEPTPLPGSNAAFADDEGEGAAEEPILASASGAALGRVRFLGPVAHMLLDLVPSGLGADALGSCRPAAAALLLAAVCSGRGQHLRLAAKVALAFELRRCGCVGEGPRPPLNVHRRRQQLAGSAGVGRGVVGGVWGWAAHA